MVGFSIYFSMSDESYDNITAQHYEAYRPPLHELILAKCLKGNVSTGLDIGCGVGHSSIALTRYCEKVIGLEPSLDMLQKVQAHPKVDYQHFDGTNINLEEDAFDVITFAGSLFYAKSQLMLDEVVTVSSINATIIVYDFEVILDRILQELGVDLNELVQEPYDHSIDFSGLQNDKIGLVMKSEESVELILDSQQLTHLLLSTKEHYAALAKVYNRDELFQSVSKHLSEISGEGSHTIEARIYYTVYESKF